MRITPRSYSKNATRSSLGKRCDEQPVKSKESIASIITRLRSVNLFLHCISLPKQIKQYDQTILLLSIRVNEGNVQESNELLEEITLAFSKLPNFSDVKRAKRTVDNALIETKIFLGSIDPFANEALKTFYKLNLCNNSHIVFHYLNSADQSALKSFVKEEVYSEYSNRDFIDKAFYFLKAIEQMILMDENEFSNTQQMPEVRKDSLLQVRKLTSEIRGHLNFLETLLLLEEDNENL